MERAGRFLAKLKFSQNISADELILAAWPAAVGKRIASHASAVAVVRGNLVVEVEDAIWKSQLFSLRSQILVKMHELLGETILTEIEFRHATRRRPPQMAQSLLPSQSQTSSPAHRGMDEADGIADRGMRIVYKQARKKAAG